MRANCKTSPNKHLEKCLTNPRAMWWHISPPAKLFQFCKSHYSHSGKGKWHLNNKDLCAVSVSLLTFFPAVNIWSFTFWTNIGVGKGSQLVKRSIREKQQQLVWPPGPRTTLECPVQLFNCKWLLYNKRHRATADKYVAVGNHQDRKHPINTLFWAWFSASWPRF